ncbi:MAG: hypothetical protein KC496_18080, partial [Anaerolineae bacterium]|nr:hypothetical protein [Anaerolineae bacterium]
LEGIIAFVLSALCIFLLANSMALAPIPANSMLYPLVALTLLLSFATAVAFSWPWDDSLPVHDAVSMAIVFGGGLASGIAGAFHWSALNANDALVWWQMIFRLSLAGVIGVVIVLIIAMLLGLFLYRTRKYGTPYLVGFLNLLLVGWISMVQGWSVLATIPFVG